MDCKISKITVGKDDKIYVTVILPDVGKHQPYSRGVTGCYPKEALTDLLKLRYKQKAV